MHNSNLLQPPARTMLLLGILMVVIVFAVFVLKKPSHKPSLSFSSIPQTASSSAKNTIGESSDSTSLGVTPNSQSAAIASIEAPPRTGCILNFIVTPNKTIVDPSGLITYVMTIANTGTESCVNASLSFYYDTSEKFMTSSPKPTASNYYWNPGTLESGEARAITVTTQAEGVNGSTVNNEACATADNSPDVCAYNLITIGTAAINPQSTTTFSLTQSLAGKEMGLWIWNSPIQMSQAYETAAINTAVSFGFNALYVTVDDYLSIAALPAGAEKTQKESAYLAALNSFVSLAKARGIAVDIEGGASDWGESENNWKGYALIDLLRDYNATYPNDPIRGLQYDVESYLLPTYDTDKATVLEAYVNFISESAVRMAAENPTSRFTIVIPHFYDSVVDWTPEIVFDGTSNYTFNDLLAALNVKSNSYIIVMAYRNFLDGTNGSIALAHTEIDKASASGVKIIVAQETGNVAPGYVTFFGKTKSNLFAALVGINEAFANYSSFGGVAVDYLDPFNTLEP